MRKEFNIGTGEITDLPDAPIVPGDIVDNNALDLAALNIALAQDGSAFRGFVLVMLDEINILRQRAGLAPRTIDQIKPAIQGKMR